MHQLQRLGQTAHGESAWLRTGPAAEGRPASKEETLPHWRTGVGFQPKEEEKDGALSWTVSVWGPAGCLRGWGRWFFGSSYHLGAGVVLHRVRLAPYWGHSLPHFLEECVHTPAHTGLQDGLQTPPRSSTPQIAVDPVPSDSPVPVTSPPQRLCYSFRVLLRNII